MWPRLLEFFKKGERGLGTLDTKPGSTLDTKPGSSSKNRPKGERGLGTLDTKPGSTLDTKPGSSSKNRPKGERGLGTLDTKPGSTLDTKPGSSSKNRPKIKCTNCGKLIRKKNDRKRIVNADGVKHLVCSACNTRIRKNFKKTTPENELMGRPLKSDSKASPGRPRSGLAARGLLQREAWSGRSTLRTALVCREVPRKLQQNNSHREVHFNMEDHRHEDCTPPKSRVKAFSSKGQLLGSDSKASPGRPRSGLAARGLLQREAWSGRSTLRTALVCREVPRKLQQNNSHREVHFNMEDHRHEDCTPPKSRVKAFSSKGQLLGSPLPTTVDGTTKPLDEKDKLANEKEAAATVALDQAAPTTSVQIHLTDGSRLVATFNHTHTVADIRRYIATARPQYEHQSFTLLTALMFPNKELTQDSQTLADADLLNAAILQRPQREL
ncbi:uncharacterized protein LOC128993997 isoform X1 [Macrosteles quadrilineatus]|uniref:uncharacterized protein LOC128993997 isoform X1 n=1 Tax=Macrosteles quadrilineatus TaxID=74068 RepID=UPI0023E2FF7F|nr:uncharacterized protein LOC128993997 isoform X1 [Macrosteles quadrilineatus]XP_054274154.1 uncharacterized protein LOC128993997 isoform X1 [Macrosteles quadrilineatus]XP_054274155.1 uncharacterized protein LOC128993997 isoform X1 [Macrosteles quadrilineatus]